MTLLEALLSPFRPVAATFLTPSSICSLYSLAAALLIAFGWLAWQCKRRRGRAPIKALIRAVFQRRVLFHRSTIADFAYCLASLMTLGSLIGWAVLSSSWISDGVAAALSAVLGPGPQPRAPEFVLDAGRTVALFLAY